MIFGLIELRLSKPSIYCYFLFRSVEAVFDRFSYPIGIFLGSLGLTWAQPIYNVNIQYKKVVINKVYYENPSYIKIKKTTYEKIR